MDKRQRPIGVFDSGVGGLTVASAIKQLLPHENIVYFGDTAHLPYGDKSADAIRGYSHHIADFLLEHDAKMILIACNSASASAFDMPDRNIFRESHWFLMLLIRLLIMSALKGFSNVGVIGTKRTISSGTYEKKIHGDSSGD